MGNCCVYKERRRASVVYKPTPRDEEDVPEVPTLPPHHDPTINSIKENNRVNSSSSIGLQHIKEREPDDSADDPSAHPQTSTIFIMRSASEKHRKNQKRRRSHYDNHHHHHHHQHHGSGHTSQKFSSCSTILIDDSTVSQPNLKNTIRAVALAIYFHIKNRDGRDVQPHDDDRALDIFDEKLNPVSKDPIPNDYFTRDPDHKTIYRFIRSLFHSAQLTAECAIVTLVYLERLLTYSDMELVPYNWKRAVLGAILLASKVWDDQAVWTVDYCQILKDITVENINELERQFLELLQFNINVSSSVYAKYYFDLRALAYAHDLSFPFEPLCKDRAVKLEAMSNVCEGKLKETRLCRSQSLDGIASNPRHSKAILS